MKIVSIIILVIGCFITNIIRSQALRWQKKEHYPKALVDIKIFKIL